MELTNLRQSRDGVVECVDNDETAAVIATLVNAKRLLILTSVEGIYLDPADPSTLVERITGKDAEETVRGDKAPAGLLRGREPQGRGRGRAKLRSAGSRCARAMEVIIGHAKYRISDLLEGKAPCTRIGINL